MRSLTANGGERRIRVGKFTDDFKIRFRLAAFPHRLARYTLIIDYHDVHLDLERSSVLGRAGNSLSVGMMISAVHSSGPVGPEMNDASLPNCTSRRSRTFLRPMPSRPASHPAPNVLTTRRTTELSAISTSTRTSTLSS